MGEPVVNVSSAIPSLQSHKLLSPGDDRLLVLGASSEHCRDVEGHCGMLQAASELA